MWKRKISYEIKKLRNLKSENMELIITHDNLVIRTDSSNLQITHNGFSVDLESIHELNHGDLFVKLNGNVKKPIKKSSSKVDSKWVSYLEEVINEMGITKPGHTIKLKVTFFGAQPMHAHIDLYEGNKKLASAGHDHRINFAVRGISDEWKNKVKKGVDYIYENKMHFIGKMNAKNINREWIKYLEDVINDMGILKAEDRIKLRVTYTHKKPTCAFLDLYRNDEKIMSAGRDYRIGFALQGITIKWKNRVKKGVEHIYKKANKLPKSKRIGDSEIIYNNNNIKNGHGYVDELIKLMQK